MEDIMDSKKNSYDEWWLRKDMQNMGHIFEYCPKYFLELYNVSIDRIKFLNAFMRSKCRYEMETGDPRLLSQAAIDTIEDYICYEHHEDPDVFVSDIQEPEHPTDQFYWIGWMYAYIHFKHDILSADLIEVKPLNHMIYDFYLGHEMDKEVYYQQIKDSLPKV